MKITKKLPDGRFVSAIACDKCGKLMEDRPIQMDGYDVCPYCFGEWWRSIKAQNKMEKEVIDG